MIPNSKAFNGNSFFEHDGKTFYRWYPVCKSGAYQLRFTVVSTNSAHRQGIALFFSDFSGQLLLNGKPLPVPTSPLKHYTFKEGEMPDNECRLSVQAESGSLIIGNASERTETGTFTCGAFGCAFWIEQKRENILRFYCNDHEYDDDFDDLIFDLEIIEI